MVNIKEQLNKMRQKNRELEDENENLQETVLSLKKQKGEMENDIFNSGKGQEGLGEGAEYER